MAKYSIEIQDSGGNVYYPHAQAGTTFLADGSTVAAQLEHFLKNPAEP